MALTDFYKVKNNAKALIAVDMADDVLVMDLDSNATMPADYPFMLTIWNPYLYGSYPSNDPNMEIVTITGISTGTTYAIERGSGSSSAHSHSSGDTAAMLLTAEIITQLQEAINALETA